MARINNLPIELLNHIFDAVLTHDSGLDLLLSRSFPFNAASVCTIWLDILKARPHYWKSRQWVIDVAQDPTPFLDTLGLCVPEDNAVTMDVVVFSSVKGEGTGLSGDNEEAHRLHENTRTRAVFNHLESSLNRCRKITFDLIFQSSLPSAANILSRELFTLESLTLTCTVHDRDDETEITIEEPSASEPNTDFPAMTNLSLTGYCFMELCQLGNAWLDSLSVDQETEVGLFIHHFKFLEHNGEEPYGSRTLEKFIDSLQSMNMQPRTSLFDLSLHYVPPADRVGEGPYTGSPSMYFSMPDFLLDTVSADFISAFFSNIRHAALDVELIRIRRSPIPRINLGYSIQVRSLHLVDIPSPPANSLAAFGAPGQDAPEDSVFNALQLFSPHFLRILRCDGVNDRLLWRLGAHGHISVKDNILEHVILYDCVHFTSGALRAFMRGRERAQRKAHGDNFMPMEMVVYGTGPLLAKEDMAWFESEYVHWTTLEQEGGGRKGLATHPDVGTPWNISEYS